MATKARVEIKGLETVRKNLRKEIGKIKGDTRSGLKLAVLWLIGRVLKVTPINFGILRNSAFTSFDEDEARLGFTADYAPPVHENTGANFKAPNTGAKFLERPIMENADRILQIVRDKARIK